MDIERLKLQLLIAQLQLQILLLRRKLTVPNLPDPKKVVIHHGGGSLDFAGVNNYHKGLWGFRSSLGYYAGYHYFIEYDGTVYQARRDNERAAHTVEQGRANYWNENSIGICLQGNTEIKKQTPKQEKALKELLDRKKKEYGDLEILGHYQISPTLCPGKYLKTYLTKLIKNANLNI